MEYITFINKIGIEHKAWACKEGNNFICFKSETISSQPERLWPQKTFANKEEADNAILKYIESGIKARIFRSKEIK